MLNPWKLRLGAVKVTGSIHIKQSPYFGAPDFSGVGARSRHVDLVSVADLLRNAFVFPPHSIYQNVKLASFGFRPGAAIESGAEFVYPFPECERGQSTSGQPADKLVETYHRLLCDAVCEATREMSTPWALQSGGKDSTSLSIAMAEVRPDATCLTYLGGTEENELASASAVAKKLGLRHEQLVCDPGRAYDRYLEARPKMPLLTADFALLSYVDLATEVAANGGDGIIDGLGSDSYFGIPASWQTRLLTLLARRIRLPHWAVELPMVESSFALCFLLNTLQMGRHERLFPGSRFSDAEVEQLMGRKLAGASRRRLAPYEKEFAAALSLGELKAMAICIAEGAGAFAKGLYSASALSIPVEYPFCNKKLREWVFREVPPNKQVDFSTGRNKILVRDHIAARFGDLPYVDQRKGSFRFDLVGLARDRFDQVRAFAHEARDIMPGAVGWLDANRGRLRNKFHASRFYLLAVVLPWLGPSGGDASWTQDEWWDFTGRQQALDPRLAARNWIRVPDSQAEGW